MSQDEDYNSYDDDEEDNEKFDNENTSDNENTGEESIVDGISFPPLPRFLLDVLQWKHFPEQCVEVVKKMFLFNTRPL